MEKVFNKNDLADQLVEECGIKKKEAKVIVDITFRTIKDVLSTQNNVDIAGFGKFQLKERKGYIGKNPKTNTTITVPAIRSIVFKPSKALKDTVK